MNTPSKTELAWAAGMIDGDGCITLTRSKSAFGKPTLVVDNTDESIIRELARLFGGSIVIKKRYQTHHRQAWSWRRYGAQQVRANLKAVLPYMRCEMKRERARMIVEEYNDVTTRNGYYTPEQKSSRQEWEQRFMDLGRGRGSRSIA